MARMREAAAVFLTRGQGSAVEIYLVERSPQLRFFGGYWALPGGTVDPVDRPGEDLETAMLRAALRELFEETGVLALAAEPADRKALRQALLEDGTEDWAALVTDQDLEQVRPVCRITTPDFAPVRYRTRFLHVALPEGEVTDIWPGELVQGRWFGAEELLAEWTQGEILLAPPVRFLVELLVGRSFEEFLAQARDFSAELERGRLHDVYFSPGIFVAPLITETVPPGVTTNCCLVGTDDRYVIDPATEDQGERTRLYELLDEHVAAGGTLKGVLVTHHHPDHVGSVAEVAERYHLEVRAHPRTLERLPLTVTPGRPLHDGDRLDLGRAPDGTGDWHLRVVFTPGHDQGHLAFFESRYRALIAGDLVSTLSTIVIDPPEGHLATYMESLRRARQLMPAMTYPSHGPAHRDGVALLDHYLTHRHEREEKLLAALTDTPQTEAALLPLVYDDVTRPEVMPYAARSLRAGLDKLQEDGKALGQSEGWSLACLDS